jgi:glycosyltransferase involved in cell wall biosynthesis
VKTIEALATYPDVEIPWKAHALLAAQEILRSEKVDGIISVWPIVGHLVARELKQEFNVPWIADFPDMWAYTYAYRYGHIRQFLDKRLELKTLLMADELVTSSWPQSRFLEKLHRRKHVHTVTIGYDPERDNVPPAALTQKFTITYTGILYGQERNPGKFLQALSELIAEGAVNKQDLAIRFYGKPDGWVHDQVRKLGLEGIVIQYDSIPWEECLKRQRESQILLQLNWENPEERGAYSGKIAEYLAARRPILCVGGFGNDVMEELMKETSVGAYCPAILEAKQAILEYYKEYKRTGKVAYAAQMQQVEKYNYRSMAESFSRILASITPKIANI